jgi:hypothetical protein
MTRSELEQLTDCGHDLAAKVALAIIAAAQVGPSTVEMEVDKETLNLIADTLSIQPEPYRSWGIAHRQIRLSFMEVDAVIYARVQR